MAPANDRDPVMDPLLSRALSGLHAADADCVDAETLAAWVERTLPSGVAGQVEAHLSCCSRCQAVMATFIRSAPVPVAVESLWKRWQMGWLVPIAGTAAAIAIYVAARPPAQPSPELVQSRVETVAPEGRAAAPELIAPAAPAVAQNAQAPGETPAGADWPVTPGTAKAEENVAREAQTPREDQPAQGFGRLSERASLPPETSRAEPTADASVPAPSASPPAAVAAPRPPAPPVQAAAGAARALSATAALEVRSVSLAERWRVAASGAVEHSVDAGATWQLAPAQVSAGIRAGASPTPGVCWLVGSGGAVWVTTDGVRFNRVPFPQAVDLVGVLSTGARNATITAGDGRMFRTDDQGETWFPTPGR